MSAPIFDSACRALLGRPGRRAALCFFAALAILCAGQIAVGIRIAGQVNHDKDAFDQGAYILMAQKMKGSPYPWYPDGTRNPLVPWLAQLWADPGDPGFFEEAKRMCVWLGGAGTALVGLLCLRRMGPLAAFAGAAVAGMGLLLPASTFFGAEVVFYVLCLLLFVSGLDLSAKNPLWAYAVFGLLAAATYLAKPSATPFVILVFAFGLVRAAWESLRPGGGRWRPANAVFGIAVFCAVYFPAISPRLIYAQATWGSAFYSLPSFWFWADSWEDCTAKYTDCRKGTIDAMPAAERPTFRGYFLRNSPGDAVKRLAEGSLERARQFVFPEKKFRFPFEKSGKPKRAILPFRGFYVVGFGVLALAMLAFAWRLRPLSVSALWGAALFACVWGAYLAAMGWYLPTGPGNRFILTLFLPTLWAALAAGEKFRAAARSRVADSVFLAGCAFAAGLVLWRLAAVLPGAEFEKILYTF